MVVIGLEVTAEREIDIGVLYPGAEKNMIEVKQKRQISREVKAAVIAQHIKKVP